MLRVKNERVINIDAEGTAHVECHLIADSASDLPEGNTLDDRVLVQGSTCWVIGESVRYALSSAGEWIRQDSDVPFATAADLRAALASGAAADRCSLGDLIEVSRTTSDSTEKTYQWEIIGVNEDGENTLTLQLYRVWPELMTMGDEALAVFPEGLAVGHYSITLPVVKALLIDEQCTMYIPIATAIPAGGKLLFSGGTLRSCQADNTIIQSYIYYKMEPVTGTEYTDLGTADGNTEHINKVERAVLGTNNYENSLLREWLNDTRPAAERDQDEWDPDNEFSLKPPSRDGFLYGWDEDFADMIVAAEKKIFAPTARDGNAYTGTVTVLTDNAWLLCYEEIGHAYPVRITSPTELTEIEGHKYPYFDVFSRIKLTSGGTAIPTLLRTMDIFSDSIITCGDDERTEPTRGTGVPGIAPCVVISGGVV